MKEVRSITGMIQMRAGTVEDITATISGYAAVFGVEQDLGWYIEKIDARAFDDCDMTDTIAAFNHNDSELLSRVTGEKDDLQFTIDATGLRYEFKAKNEDAKEVAKNIELGFVRGSSFQFSTKEDAWEYDVAQDGGEKKDIRTLLKIEKLFDVGPVTFPAYDLATAESNSANKELRSIVEANRPKPEQAPVDLQNELLKIKLNK